jgi:hypothetical protein
MANQIIRSDRGHVELLIEGSGALLARMAPHSGDELFRLGQWTNEVLDGLRGLDGNMPAPLFVAIGEIANVGHLTASHRNAQWQRFRESAAEGPRRVCSLFLRFATSTGTPVEETFLGFFPFNLFPPPTIQEGGTLSQEEFTRKWEAGQGDFLLTFFFETDVYDLSRALRDWCKARTGEFPFRFERNAMPSAITRSALTMRFPGVRDRVWHRDRPIIFEFRPVNRKEAYQLEASYWRSVKDNRRAELADEIRARLEEAAATQPVSALGQPLGAGRAQAGS